LKSKSSQIGEKASIHLESRGRGLGDYQLKVPTKENVQNRNISVYSNNLLSTFIIILGWKLLIRHDEDDI
jgi:hypothetical protein